MKSVNLIELELWAQKKLVESVDQFEQLHFGLCESDKMRLVVVPGRLSPSDDHFSNEKRNDGSWAEFGFQSQEKTILPVAFFFGSSASSSSRFIFVTSRIAFSILVFSYPYYLLTAELLLAPKPLPF